MFVGGLIEPVSTEELLEAFSCYGAVCDVRNPPKKPLAFVNFFHAADADAAVAAVRSFGVGLPFGSSFPAFSGTISLIPLAGLTIVEEQCLFPLK